MRFELDGRIMFSKELTEEAIKSAEEVIKNSREIFLKGVPKGKEDEASKIIDYKFEGNQLKLKIVSGTYTRAHEGLIRLRKPLAQKLGREHRIGVRDIIIDHYVITIPSEKAEKLKGKKVPECEVEIDNNEIKLIFENVGDSELKRNIIDRAIKFVKNELEKEERDLTFEVCKIPPGTIVREYKAKRKITFDKDPTDVAEELGWVKKFPGRGQWFYAPPMAALFRAMEELIVEEVVKKLGFEECLFPKLIPLEIMYKMRYLEGLPEGMYYVCPPKREPELFEEFVSEMMIKKEIPIEKLKNLLRDPGYVLAPAQCEPFYQFFDHEMIDVDKPIKFFDRSGWTYRWEGGGARGLDRVNEFLRVECVWIGSPEFVEKTRDETLKYAEKLAEKLDLEYWVEVGDDPFYLEGRKKEDRGIEFPDVPKYEMRLLLPHIKDERKGVAVTSANVHGTHFVEGFGIKDYKGRRVWTGCTGYGITRWVVGFLAQYGFEFDDWPELIKKKIKKLPEVPKLITWP
ncbi:serine--tRNA ligase [Methanotorris igneus]|uniref:Type-2 serine--tRNA ligase n=1 Tax=Methanotorris igneus (strain DSM 5666 / JCM 11834 / Kol 5) TaxID=880724 RepID=F6BEW5_METIK|nr:serine--tRNA ligase [Methanotorris igneus]AEF95701.1 Type-2 seryl-tRNA synthetase [Methanotorris igneus Kol 5]